MIRVFSIFRATYHQRGGHLIKVPGVELTIMLGLLMQLAACGRQGLVLDHNDPEYPAINAKRLHFTSLIVDTPPELSSTIFANYGTTLKDDSCETKIGEASETLRLSVPLDQAALSTATERNYNVNIDRYRPGKCGWIFSGLSASIKKGPLVGPEAGFMDAKAYVTAFYPWEVNEYMADHRPGPIWRCRRALNYSTNTPILACSASEAEQERTLLDERMRHERFVVVDAER